MAILLHILAIGVAVATAACSASQPPQATGPKAPLYDNLGNYHTPITTTSPEAQKYFDQGLTLSYAFNHAEAIRAFRQAAALDPGLRDVLLGRGVRARAEHQRADHRGRGQGGVRRRSSRRGSARRQRVGEGARVHRRAGEALRRRSEGRARAARSRLRRRDARGRRSVPGRSRRRDALRAVADGHLAVELLGRRTAARAQFTGEVLASLESVLDAQARSHRRDPPLHPRRRGVAQSRPRRRSTPTGSARSCPAPATSCTCRRTSTCAPAATTTPRSRTQHAIKADEAYFKPATRSPAT